MRNRITDTEAELLLAGTSPQGRPEFSALADAVVEIRQAAFETIPQPTAALAARLGLPQEALVSAMATAPAAPSRLMNVETSSAASAAEAPRTKGIKRMFEWIAGLGLAAKLAAGTGALALGITGMGAAGALPSGAQGAFDTVVSTVISSETEAEVEVEVAEEDVVEEEAPADETLPTGSEEFSSWVSENAQDEDKVGAEFGAAVSEQAQELRDEKAAARTEAEAEGDAEVGDDEAEVEVEGEVEVEVEGGKPADLPGTP